MRALETLAELRGLLDRVDEPAAADDARLDTLLARGVEATPEAEPDLPVLDHDRVRAADPLGLDDALRELPAVNRAGDVAALVGWSRRAAGRGADLDLEEATAALRDAGMLLGSLRRAGVEPLTVVPELEPRLTSWAARTGMVPRDTVVHYGLWNPPGERLRRFVDEGAQEAALIDSVRRSCRLLPLAGAALDLAWHHDLTSDAGLVALRIMRDAVVAFGEGFASVREVVSPQFFAEQLRPFFDPVTVAGTAYSGPAAAFIPLYLVDELLWGGGDELTVMHEEALIYARPLWRRARQRIADHPPVAAALEARLAAGRGPALTEALELANAAVHALLRFRGQHVTTARRAYAYEVTSYRHGSGGFAPDELKVVADEERRAASVLNASRLDAEGTGP